MNNVLKSDALTNLIQAQRLLEYVYGYAQDIKDENIERLMSVADSCIIDAMEAMGGKQHDNI